MAKYFFSENPNPLHLALFKRYLDEGFDNEKCMGWSDTKFMEREDYESLKIIISSPDFNVNHCDDSAKKYFQLKHGERNSENDEKIKRMFEPNVYDVKSLGTNDRNFLQSLKCDVQHIPSSHFTIWHDDTPLFGLAMNARNFKAAKIICEANIDLNVDHLESVLHTLEAYDTELSTDWKFDHNYHKSIQRLFELLEVLFTKGIDSIYRSFGSRMLEIVFGKIGEYEYRAFRLEGNRCEKENGKIFLVKQRIAELLMKRNINPFTGVIGGIGGIGGIGESKLITGHDEPLLFHVSIINKFENIRKNYEQKYLTDVLRDSTLYSSYLPSDLIKYYLLRFIL